MRLVLFLVAVSVSAADPGLQASEGDTRVMQILLNSLRLLSDSNTQLQKNVEDLRADVNLIKSAMQTHVNDYTTRLTLLPKDIEKAFLASGYQVEALAWFANQTAAAVERITQAAVEQTRLLRQASDTATEEDDHSVAEPHLP